MNGLRGYCLQTLWPNPIRQTVWHYPRWYPTLPSTADLNLSNEVLSAYFEEWLAGLPTESIQTIFRAEGLDKVKRAFPFRRYVLERNDLGMDDFLKKNLSPEDYQYQLGLGKTIDS